MKKTRRVAQESEPAKPSPVVVIPGEQGHALQAESNLSPQRMMEGASATTALLSQILAQPEELHQLRDWGINE